MHEQAGGVARHVIRKARSPAQIAPAEIMVYRRAKAGAPKLQLTTTLCRALAVKARRMDVAASVSGAPRATERAEARVMASTSKRPVIAANT